MHSARVGSHRLKTKMVLGLRIDDFWFSWHGFCWIWPSAKQRLCMYECIWLYTGCVFIYVCVEYLLVISISCSINPIACCEKKCDCTQAKCWVFSSAPWPCRRSPYQGKSSCSLMVLLGKTYAETNGFQMVFPSSLGFCSRDSWIFLRFPEHGTRHLLVMKNKEKKWKNSVAANIHNILFPNRQHRDTWSHMPRRTLQRTR